MPVSITSHIAYPARPKSTEPDSELVQTSRYQVWSDASDKILISQYRITPVSKLAVILGRSRDAVLGRAQRLGLMVPHQKRREVKVSV